MAGLGLVNDSRDPPLALVSIAHRRLYSWYALDSGYARDVVEDAPVEVSYLRVIELVRTLEALAKWYHQGSVERGDRPLGAGVEMAQRLYEVADELHPRRIALACGKKVDDATPHAELTVGVDGVLRREPGVSQQIAEVGGGQFASKHEFPRRFE